MGMSPKLLRPRATGFTPKSISGLAAWYDASVTSSITIQTGVQQWSDLSGNGRHLTQNTTNNQPQHGAVTLNGRPVVTFDGANDFLRTAAFTITQPYQTFLVFRFQSAYSISRRVLEHRTLGGTRSGEIYNISSSSLTLYSGGVIGLTGLPAGAREAFNIYDVELNGANSRMRFRQTAVSGNPGANGGNGFTIGANGNTTPTEWGDVSIAEIVHYSKALTDTQADQVRNYLGRKWNLAVS
jgi:hypothetical protein